jgi:integrase
MPRNQLTDNQIKNSKPSPSVKDPSKGYWISDGEGLRVLVTGERKVFYFVYRLTRTTPEKKLIIGEYRKGLISLADARVKADEYRAMRANGLDPLEERARRIADGKAARKAIITMTQAFDYWFAENKPNMSSEWQAVRRSHWMCNVDPVMGGVLLPDASKRGAMGIYDRLASEGKHTTARKVVSLIKQVVSWCVLRDYCLETHSIALMPLPKAAKKPAQKDAAASFNIGDYLAERGGLSALNDESDNRAGRALSFAELSVFLGDALLRSNANKTHKNTMRLMLATGLRASETTRLRWAWLDLDAALLVVPAVAMKKSRDHLVPLSAYAVNVLKEQKLIAGESPFVFPDSKDSHVRRDGLNKTLTARQLYTIPDETAAQHAARMAKRIALRRNNAEMDLFNLTGGAFTLYDLRRTVATRLEELGISREIVAKCLSHAGDDAATTGRYARSAHWEARQNALNALGNALESCERGLNPSAYASDNVVFLDKRAG